MKTHQSAINLQVTDDSSRSAWHDAGTTRSMITACAMALAFGIVTTDARERNICDLTAQGVYSSDLALARSNYKLSLAKALNITDSKDRKKVTKRALRKYLQTRKDIRKQRDARLEACEKLGRKAYDPKIDPSNFVSGITNPYFPLTPGKTYIYEGKTEDGLERVEFAVTHNTRTIMGVTCIEVRDIGTLNGVVIEDTLDWFAQDKKGNVWYFGENTAEYDNGLIVTTAGSFEAGKQGDKPGIIMKASPETGDFYRQEYSLANAEDLAETVALGKTVTVKAGTFTNCLKSRESTPIEPDVREHKFFAPGVGNVLTIDLENGDRFELIEIKTE